MMASQHEQHVDARGLEVTRRCFFFIRFCSVIHFPSSIIIISNNDDHHPREQREGHEKTKRGAQQKHKVCRWNETDVRLEVCSIHIILTRIDRFPF